MPRLRRSAARGPHRLRLRVVFPGGVRECRRSAPGDGAMRSQIGASYVARAGNGSTPASRRFSEEVPPVKLWAEAVAVLAAGLSAIVRNPDQASTIAMA